MMFGDLEAALANDPLAGEPGPNAIGVVLSAGDHGRRVLAGRPKGAARDADRYQLRPAVLWCGDSRPGSGGRAVTEALRSGCR